MNLATYAAVLVSLFICVNGQQRVAPGVPPQQYQDPMQHVPQHMPQQQMHMQQVPQMQHQQPQQYQVPQQQVHHQQQVPQQVHHQQQMPQQVPVQNVQQPHIQHHAQVPSQAHGHGHAPHGQILNAANIAQEKQHIQEHMEVPIDTSKMTDQELQFHYFKMHDADNNNKLDGCELIKSLIHWHEQGHKDPNAAQHGQHPPPQEKIFKDDELVALIDPIMNMDDADGDGFIDYPEFVRAQNKAAAAGTGAPRT